MSVMLLTLVGFTTIAVILIPQFVALRRVRETNARLAADYESAKAEARRIGAPPPCPPNVVVLR